MSEPTTENTESKSAEERIASLEQEVARLHTLFSAITHTQRQALKLQSTQANLVNERMQLMKQMMDRVAHELHLDHDHAPQQELVDAMVGVVPATDGNFKTLPLQAIYHGQLSDSHPYTYDLMMVPENDQEEPKTLNPADVSPLIRDRIEAALVAYVKAYPKEVNQVVGLTIDAQTRLPINQDSVQVQPNGVAILEA